MSPGTSRTRSPFVDVLARERVFLLVLGVGFLVAGITYPIPQVAAWVGFLFASYSAVANDSIQTVGTFLASNRDKPWWLLWLFIGGIFLLTMTYGWVVYDGDVSYQRLASKGFAEAPRSFSFLQVAAPLFLLILTRLRMPVSTTFLLLTSFTTSVEGVGSVLAKSLIGYVVAFAGAVVVWLALSKAMERWLRRPAHPGWMAAQWVTSGILWSVWLMQDAANIAVYLPRSLDLVQFVAFSATIFFGLGILFRIGGERVQEVVDEKSDVVDVRGATLIDLIYAAILYYFKEVSNVPMSTTWVFIGLLGGRELAMALRGASVRSWQQAVQLMLKDLFYVSVGLLVSILIALSVNDSFHHLIEF